MTQVSEKHIVSGDAAVLARRYAGALFELAQDAKQIDAVAADMRALRQLTVESVEFQTLARNPRLTRTQLVHLAKSVGESLKLNRLTANFLMLSAQKRRLVLLAPMVEAFLDLMASQRGEYTATVRTATPLTPQQTEQLTQRLAALAGGKVHIDAREDKTLIGGLTVRLGSRLIDASVRSKLERMERRLKAGAAA